MFSLPLSLLPFGIHMSSQNDEEKHDNLIGLANHLVLTTYSIFYNWKWARKSEKTKKKKTTLNSLISMGEKLAWVILIFSSQSGIIVGPSPWIFPQVCKKTSDQHLT